MSTPRPPSPAVCADSSISRPAVETTDSFASELDEAIRKAQQPFPRLEWHHSVDSPNTDISDSDPEARAADQPTSTQWLPPRDRLRLFMLQEIVQNHFLEAQLLALTVATGIIDAITFTNYSVFVSKQTGNTVFLALHASRNPVVLGIEKNVGASISAFILGAAFFGHIGHLLKQRRRSWLLFSNVFQCVLVYAACAIRFWVSDVGRGPAAIVVVILLSIAFGGQISLAICVKLPELNTTMITGALIQIATDRAFFSIHNGPRNRRILFYCSLLGGAFVGAALTSRTNPTLALLVCAILKTVVGFSFLFNHGLVGGTKDLPNSGTVTPLTKILWGD